LVIPLSLSRLKRVEGFSIVGMKKASKFLMLEDIFRLVFSFGRSQKLESVFVYYRLYTKIHCDCSPK
jgi:hypothetical protein